MIVRDTISKEEWDKIREDVKNLEENPNLMMVAPPSIVDAEMARNGLLDLSIMILIVCTAVLFFVDSKVWLIVAGILSVIVIILHALLDSFIRYFHNIVREDMPQLIRDYLKAKLSDYTSSTLDVIRYEERNKELFISYRYEGLECETCISDYTIKKPTETEKSGMIVANVIEYDLNRDIEKGNLFNVILYKE